MRSETKEYWVCIIGPVKSSKLLHGADYPPRRAAIKAVELMTDEGFSCWSGWGVTEKARNKIMKVWNQ